MQLTLYEFDNLAKNKQSILISLNITVRNLCKISLKRGQIEYKSILSI